MLVVAIPAAIYRSAPGPGPSQRRPWFAVRMDGTVLMAATALMELQRVAGMLGQRYFSWVHAEGSAGH